MIQQRRVAFSILLLSSLILGLGGIFAPAPAPVNAQEIIPTNTWVTRQPTPTPEVVEPHWTYPKLIFTSRGVMHTPYLVADKTGRVHLFWKIIEPAGVDGESSTNIIFYSQKTSSGWTQPVDIQVAASIFNPAAVVDDFGMIHLFWSGENQQLFYSRARVDQATEAKNWSQPLGFERMNYAPHVVLDKNNVLHVVYPGSQASGVYYMRSTDGGDHWSSSRNISPTDQLNTSAEYARIAISPNGVLHVVWTEFLLPTGWPPTGIFYSRSEDGGETWTTRKQLTAMNYDQANIIVPVENEVHVVWNAIVSVQGRYHRWSRDNGENWSTVSPITRLGGTEGIPQLAVDSTGRMHVFTTYDECANYHYLNAAAWSERLCLVDQPVTVSNLAWTTYIEEAAMTISNGNHLHAVFWDNRTRLWYSELDLGQALVSPTQVFVTRQPPTSTPTRILPTGSPTNTATPIPAGIYEGEIKNPKPLDSLALDLLPSFLVLCTGIGVVIYIRSKRGRS